MSRWHRDVHLAEFYCRQREPIPPAAWVVGVLFMLVLMVLTVGYQRGLENDRQCVRGKQLSGDTRSYAEVERDC